MRAPSVTVCIPTYNRAAFLAAAINSVLTQSIGDYAVLVTDNASEDNTAEVVRGFGDPRIRYLRHAENIGPGANFNACLRAADSEFVLILGDDDVLHPEMLETSIGALRADDRVGFAFTPWRQRRDDGTVDARLMNPSLLTTSTTLSGRAFIDFAIRTQSNIAHLSSSLMRTRAIPPDGFDLRDSFAMDVGLLLRMAVHWDAAYLADPLLSVRVEPDSLTGRIVGIGANGRVRWDLDADVKRREVKTRFLQGPGRDLPNAAKLTRTVNRIFRRRVMWHSAMALRHGGQVRAAGRMLAQGAAVDTGVVWDLYAWRTGLAVLAGPALTNLLRNRRT